MCFIKSYDPFFLYPYEKIEGDGVNEVEKFPEPIVRLFKMNISYVYRLIKMNKEIIRILSNTQVIESNITKLLLILFII